MISRVAETCFWMHRQVERADAMARLLRVNRGFVIDAGLPEARKWYPLLVVAGEHERFDEKHEKADRADAALVQDYLVWNDENPVSIWSAVYWARENARSVRDVMSFDVWRVINEHWHWLSGGPGRRLYNSDPDAFYSRISDAAAMFQGVCRNSLLHETPYDFMRLGMLLERAGQTARVLDVHHHMFESEISTNGEGQVAADDDTDSASTALARLQWIALLRSCSATEPFLKRYRATPTARSVVEFLVQDATFPRSVLFCIENATLLAKGLRPAPGRGESSVAALTALTASVRALTGDELEKIGTHQALTRIVDETMSVCSVLHRDYFDTGPRIRDANVDARAA